MNYITIDKCDISNGTGIGVVLWVSGCDLNCEGCHNKAYKDPACGQVFDSASYELLEEALKNPHVNRLTLSGGHPLMPCNRAEIYNILKWVKSNFPHIEIWLYTGYSFRKAYVMCRDIIRLCDVVVDGPFIQKKRDVTLAFRGSTNQNIIDVKSTLKKKRLVLKTIN